MSRFPVPAGDHVDAETQRPCLQRCFAARGYPGDWARRINHGILFAASGIPDTQPDPSPPSRRETLPTGICRKRRTCSWGPAYPWCRRSAGTPRHPRQGSPHRPGASWSCREHKEACLKRKAPTGADAVVVWANRMAHAGAACVRLISLDRLDRAMPDDPWAALALDAVSTRVTPVCRCSANGL